ncbi:protein kilB [Streptomyces misionensis]|uniref:protein kilB n=1 Tax=Streptomyces misionensis TaxID=67331 RepID=UPI0036C3E0C6
MLTALIAVLGTLAGSLLTGVIQHAARRSDIAAARHADGLAAVTELVAALADHRRAMWVREGLRLRGEDWTEARAESHRTRSAVTIPLLRVQLLMPSVAALARSAADATYAMRHPADEDVLAHQRDIAIHRTDVLVTAAGRHLAA